jgi:hypothetical protein
MVSALHWMDPVGARSELQVTGHMKPSGTLVPGAAKRPCTKELGNVHQCSSYFVQLAIMA